MSYQCPSCGNEFEKGTKFCNGCGYDLATNFMEEPICPICNTIYPPNTKHCVNDGSLLVKNENNTVAQPMVTVYEFTGYPKASLGSRIGAAFIDGFITLGLCIPAFIFLFIGISKSSHYYHRGAGKFYFFAVIFFIFPIVYSYIKDGLGQGQSIGKKSVGLMVVNLETNTPCTKGKSAFRNFISGLVSAIPYVGWMVEPIMVLATADGRKLGDKAANTQVIEKSEFRPTI